MDALVSIIIPTYNRAHLIGETLDSVLDQNYKNWECIVVDDGSGDYTPQLMEFYILKDKRFRYLRRPEDKPKGANACRNFGFQYSLGTYVNFFDSDDILHPDKLKIQLGHLQNNNNSFCVSQVRFFKGSEENILSDWKGKIMAQEPLEAYVKGEISWLTSAVLWKKSFLKKLDHLFDEDLHASQEWEFHIRVLSKNPEYVLDPTPLVYMRKHDENISYDPDSLKRDWNYFLARFKVYTNRNIENSEMLNFLRKYLLDQFKGMVRKNNPKAFSAFKLYILPEAGIETKSKIYALFSLLSFKVFGKGDFFLNKLILTK